MIGYFLTLILLDERSCFFSTAAGHYSGNTALYPSAEAPKGKTQARQQ